MNLYAIHDILVGAYMNVITSDSDARIVRDFGDLILKGDSPMSQHTSDYTLEKLGEFDQVTGAITPCAPVVLAHAYDFAKKDN